ncbi:MAG: hypothetical protein E6X32_02065 [Varibaculum cambriense]|uniref:hypothetical protein n=1 Tax=Varibaculum cambriense TaxID=184870 RepID=UPI00290F7A8C|nr:hypothetical protein [Varibaculum cambriense]MDU4944383.1 hypothetical protein [Varibaculum cambriense]MDU5542225.1 hypothetical protein [Varibaculum cambriense]
MALLVVCLVGGGIYWFGFRESPAAVDSKDEGPNTVLTGMKNKPKIVPIAAAEGALASSEHQGEVLYFNAKEIWLWDLNAQNERWRVDNPLPKEYFADSHPDVFAETNESGYALITASIYGDESDVSSYLALSTKDGKVTGQKNDLPQASTHLLMNFKGQVFGCLNKGDLVVFKGVGKMDTPAWTKSGACPEGATLGYSETTVTVDNDNRSDLGDEGSSPQDRAEYRLSDGKKLKNDFGDGSEQGSGKLAKEKEKQLEQDRQVKEGYFIYLTSDSGKYQLLSPLRGDSEADIVFNPSTKEEVSKIKTPEGFEYVDITSIDDKYAWGVASGTKETEEGVERYVSKAFVFDVETGKVNDKVLSAENAQETEWQVTMFRTSEGVILRHADKLTHLDKNGKELWQLDITKGGGVDMSYWDKNQKKPYLVISNDQSVIDRYLQ